MSYLNITVGNIAELKNYPVGTDEITAFVQAYTNRGDGGGGTFIFKRPLSGIATDDGGIFIAPTTQTSGHEGMWIRQFTGFIDVRFYGVMGENPSVDATDGFQAAINYAAKSTANYPANPFIYNKSNVVFVPNGEYKVKQLTLKTGVTLMGSSSEHTKIGVHPDSTADYLIQMAPGVNRSVNISGIWFVGNRVANFNPLTGKLIGGLNFTAQLDGNPDKVSGGLWESSIKNVLITNFTRHSLLFGGGGDEIDYQYNLMNQFITLENVFIEGVSDLKPDFPTFDIPNSLQIIGQNAQFSFTNCRVDSGPYKVAAGVPNYTINGINVYIGPLQNGIVSPCIITFNTCTFQFGEHAIFIQDSSNIKIDGCWFENLNRAIVAKGSSIDKTAKAINILNNYFLYSATPYKTVPNSGRVILAEFAHVNVHNNQVMDPRNNSGHTYFVSVENINNTIGINGSGNYFNNAPTNLGDTQGIKRNIDISNLTTTENLVTSKNDINLISSRMVILATGTSLKIVNEIKSNAVGGEFIIIQAVGGNIKFTELYNIRLGLLAGGTGQITLNNGRFALFAKIDGFYYSKSTPNGPKDFFDIYQLININ
ncbi:hypothetical protein HYN59_02450 [Flavobacterium album]|uniref:Pectate lyase superfamily protein domain-containing protein n=1 Tax=Flavobacterium album TaxID=2175091 RepID=A0A2S1QUN3_9FLAO|nr:hypothetical protein [Flavobacterium album]AWH84039.1 hypothetical protein HYN59_02450 [Flavobacterium album]